MDAIADPSGFTDSSKDFQNDRNAVFLGSAKDARVMSILRGVMVALSEGIYIPPIES